MAIATVGMWAGYRPGHELDDDVLLEVPRCWWESASTTA
jgi:hypothetical protein